MEQTIGYEVILPYVETLSAHSQNGTSVLKLTVEDMDGEYLADIIRNHFDAAEKAPHHGVKYGKTPPRDMVEVFGDLLSERGLFDEMREHMARMEAEA